MSETLAAEAVVHADWDAPGNVAAFTTMRRGTGHSVAPFDTFNLGLRSGDDAATVERNRGELHDRFGLPSAPRWLRQVHGTHVVVEPGSDEPEADAAVTRHRGTVLAILTADCMPVVFASRDGDELGVAHAGWRGLAAGVLEATLAEMHTPREKIVAWLGPAAGQASYEVGAEVFDAFVSQHAAAAAAFVPTRPGHSRVDLYALARQRLAHAGVMDVHGGGFDTIGDARFFSHRRDQKAGRMATIAWML
jgi:YfiH family protein